MLRNSCSVPKRRSQVDQRGIERARINQLTGQFGWPASIYVAELSVIPYIIRASA